MDIADSMISAVLGGPSPSNSDMFRPMLEEPWMIASVCALFYLLDPNHFRRAEAFLLFAFPQTLSMILRLMIHNVDHLPGAVGTIFRRYQDILVEKLAVVAPQLIASMLLLIAMPF